MSNDVINIVLTCDDKYAQHAAVTIVSVVKNTKRKVHFYVFDCGILPENLGRLKQLDVGSNVLEVVQVQKIDAFENYKYPRCYSPAIMYRLAIPEILPHLDKALYLDSDIIAVRDIGLVYDIDLGDKLLAGKTGRSVRSQFSEANSSKDCTKLGIMTGVLLMNLKKMREWNFYERVVEVVKESEIEQCTDQECLYVCLNNDQVMVLAYSCFMFNFPCCSIDSNTPLFYHSAEKPWRFHPWILRCCPGVYFSYMYKYYEYLGNTSFKGFRYRCASIKYSLHYVLVRFAFNCVTFCQYNGLLPLKPACRWLLRKIVKNSKNK